MKRVLLTGGTGLLGRELVPCLQAAGPSPPSLSTSPATALRASTPSSTPTSSERFRRGRQLIDSIGASSGLFVGREAGRQ